MTLALTDANTLTAAQRAALKMAALGPGMLRARNGWRRAGEGHLVRAETAETLISAGLLKINKVPANPRLTPTYHGLLMIRLLEEARSKPAGTKPAAKGASH